MRKLTITATMLLLLFAVVLSAGCIFGADSQIEVYDLHNINIKTGKVLSDMPTTVDVRYKDSYRHIVHLDIGSTPDYTVCIRAHELTRETGDYLDLVYIINDDTHFTKDQFIADAKRLCEVNPPGSKYNEYRIKSVTVFEGKSWRYKEGEYPMFVDTGKNIVSDCVRFNLI